MNVLFLTDEFYPLFGADSLIVKTVAREMIRRGIKVTVMPACYDVADGREEVFEGIRILRTIPGDGIETLCRRLSEGDLGTAALVAARHAAKKLTASRYLWAKDRVFARSVIREVIEKERIDAVFSIHCSAELSFPLLWLRRHGKLPCKWFFYMLDPFASHSYYLEHYSAAALRRCQHAIMKESDGTFATEIICRETAQWEEKAITDKLYPTEFPKIEPFSVVPCGDDIDLEKGSLNVVCTGSRNESVRPSAYALDACAHLREKNVRFHFVGTGWTEEDQKREGNCVFYTPRSAQAIRNLQCRADVLMNIGNVVDNQLPSKVLEYIASGRPIVDFCKSGKSPTVELLEGRDALILMERETDAETAAARFAAFLNAPHETVPFEKTARDYARYTPAFVVDRMIEKIKAE